MTDRKRKEQAGAGGVVKKALLLDLLKGLRVTLGYNVSKSITHRYPDEEKWIPYKRFRGRHTLNRTPDGKELCVACELCVKACPTRCITVVPMEDDTGRGIADRVPKVWRVDLVRCLFCGYCEDACPTRAVRLGRDYELACFSLEEAVRNREELLKPQEIPEDFEGGLIVKARLEKGEKGPRVRPDLTKQKRRAW
ncbi:MAG TPA: NADH-quinone oxidoreductase subunit I [Deltaproteobacteria bacterium]|nr:NADH-quinone oxidoreductase subunit I [Deltaproteobacteria bacterium]